LILNFILSTNLELLSGTRELRFQRELLRRLEELKGLISEVKETQLRMRENQSHDVISNAQDCALIPVNSDIQWGELERALKDKENKTLLVSKNLPSVNQVLIFFFENRCEFC